MAQIELPEPRKDKSKELTPGQRGQIERILKLSSSDSKFAEKAFLAIVAVVEDDPVATPFLELGI